MRVSSFNKRPLMVRRLVYELAVGGLSDRKVVVTTCGNMLCCNPEHMKLWTRAAVGTKGLILLNSKMTFKERSRIRNKMLGKTVKEAWHP